MHYCINNNNNVNYFSWSYIMFSNIPKIIMLFFTMNHYWLMNRNIKEIDTFSYCYIHACVTLEQIRFREKHGAFRLYLNWRTIYVKRTQNLLTCTRLCKPKSTQNAKAGFHYLEILKRSARTVSSAGKLKQQAFLYTFFKNIKSKMPNIKWKNFIVVYFNEIKFRFWRLHKLEICELLFWRDNENKNWSVNGIYLKDEYREVQ